MASAVTLPPQRLAVPADAPELAALMRESILELFPRYYDERQTASAAVYVGDPDLALIEDRTYFVHEAAGELVSCGGWSRRDKLFTGAGARAGEARLLDPRTEPARVRAMFVRSDWTRRGLGRAILEACERAARAEGFRMLALMATLPGEPLYRAFGFRELERTLVAMPDGVALECVAMERPIEPEPAQHVLAYVFWHRPRDGVDGELYEERLRAFHAALETPSAAFRVETLPFAPGAGYEDWYLVEDWAGLGALNAAAVDERRRAPHDRAAELAAEGWGGVYALLRGPAVPPERAHWLTKPKDESYDAFLAGLAGVAVWQRQLVLGPAPEFCVAGRGAGGRERVGGGPA